MAKEKFVNTAALVAGDMATYMFHQVVQNQLPVTNLSKMAHNLPKLFSELEAKPYTSFFIDLYHLAGDPAEIVEYIIGLRDKTGAPFVLFALDSKMSNHMNEALLNNGFEMWVISGAMAGMREQLTNCLQGVNNAIELAQRQLEERKKLEENVKPGHRTLGFAGSISGCGTTTQALQYAMRLLRLGYKVCYVEYGDQGDIKAIPSFDTVQFMDSNHGFLQYRGLDMYYKPVMVTANMRLAYDVCVYDYGVLTPANMSSFLSCTAKICVLGTMPWEFGKTRYALKLLEREKVVYMMPLVSKPDKAYILGKLKNSNLEIQYPVLWPDTFSPAPKNKAMYKYIDQLLAVAGK